MQIIHIFFGVLVALLMGCVHKVVVEDEGFSEPPNGGISIRIQWYEIRNNRIAISTILANHYPFEAVIPANSVMLSVDGDGSVKARANPRWVLPPEGRRQIVAFYQFERNLEGSLKAALKVQYIYKGEETTAMVSEMRTASQSATESTAVLLDKGLAISSGETKGRGAGKARTYESKVFKEGERLKPVVLEFEFRR